MKLKIVSLILGCMALSSHADIVTIPFAEDFTGFSPAPLAGQGGWTTTGTSLTVATNLTTAAVGLGINQHALTHLESGTPVSGLSALTKSVSFTVNMRSRKASSFYTLFRIFDENSNEMVEFGNDKASGFVFQGSNNYLTLATAAPDDRLSTTKHQYYDYVFSYDFLINSGSLTVRNVANDANASVLTTFNASNMGSNFSTDPTTWNSIEIIAGTPSDMVIDIKVETVIPEASSMALIGMTTLLMLIGRRVIDFHKNAK